MTGFFAVAVELGHTTSTTQLPATTGYTLSRSSQGVEDSRSERVKLVRSGGGLGTTPLIVAHSTAL